MAAGSPRKKGYKKIVGQQCAIGQSGAAATGVIAILDANSITNGKIITINDGVNAAHVLTFAIGDGTGTTKDVVDIGGGPEAGDVASRIKVAVDLADTAGDLDMSCSVLGGEATLTNDATGAFNDAITTDEVGGVLTVAGMSGGTAATVVPNCTNTMTEAEAIQHLADRNIS